MCPTRWCAEHRKLKCRQYRRQKPTDSSPVTVRRRSKSGPKDSLPRFSISVEDESLMFQQKGKYAALHNLGDGFFSLVGHVVLFKLQRNFQCRGTLTCTIAPLSPPPPKKKETCRITCTVIITGHYFYALPLQD